MLTVLLYTLVCALFTSVLPFSQATPITVTSSSSSSSSSGASYVNGQLVSGHCEASKNGYNSGCNDPNFASVPDAITTVTPGYSMPPFPPMMNGLPSFPPMMNGFPSFPPMMNGFPSFPPMMSGLPPFPNFNNFGNGFQMPNSLFPGFDSWAPFGNLNNNGLF